MGKKPVLVLAILDGWGVGRNDFTNPMARADLKTIPYLERHYPSGSLQASGIAVGLTWGEVGNSEVGHLTIGAGKVLYQHFPRIMLAIQHGEFQTNPVFQAGFTHVKKNGSALHIAGLLTEGSIHAAFEHLEALIESAKDAGVPKVYLHLFADGKDSRPRSVLSLLAKLREVTERTGVGILASLSGRHFALDRDNHFDRTKTAYEVMVGLAPVETRPLEEVIATFYEGDQSDEYLPPIRINEQGAVSHNDALIFIDFREDSIRQISSTFIDSSFSAFPLKKIDNLYVATMTEYAKHFTVPVAFPPETVDAPLGKVLADEGYKQLLIAETEKYAHVTYFFNGYRDEPFPGQTKILIPSRNVDRHDSEPRMMAMAIADKVVEAVRTHEFDVVIVNFANADMVAHTGNFNAGVIAVQTVDEQLGRVVRACEETGGYLVVTADHGNAEVMVDAMTGHPETTHDSNPVPLYVVGPGLKHAETDRPQISSFGATGILADVAPTILALLDVPKPEAMTGQNLLPILTL